MAAKFEAIRASQAIRRYRMAASRLVHTLQDLRQKHNPSAIEQAFSVRPSESRAEPFPLNTGPVGTHAPTIPLAN